MVAGFDTNRAIGGDHAETGLGDLAGEVLEEEERRTVGPVQIVEAEEYAAGLGRGGGGDQEGGHSLEECVALRLGAAPG